ncbi:MAG: diguanylate cyclase (GGDEF)-like protein [Mariniblastus sp.]|jgi:diguanylate cyclase (GGDEF)-like protein
MLYHELNTQKPDPEMIMIPTKHRILIVDDNPAIHGDFRKILGKKTESELDSAAAEFFGDTETESNKFVAQEAEWELSFADQGLKAIKMIEDSIRENNPFSMAFIDIRMPPGIDGIETTKAIWKIDPGLQVVICTAYSDYRWEDMIAAIGGNDQLLILKKPFDNIEVLQLVTALTRKRYLAALAHSKMTDLEILAARRTEKLKELAEMDALTRLPNRNRLIDTLNSRVACNSAERVCQRDALLFIDVDNFKNINDSFGHSFGDELLKVIAARLQSACDHFQKGSGTVLPARIGGDEFAVFAQDVSSEQAQNFANSLVEELRMPVAIENAARSITVSCSVGLAFIDQDTQTAEEILMKSDTAMYAAKSKGKNRHCLFHQSMHDDVVHRTKVEQDLRDALRCNEFILYAQPIVSLADLSCSHVETLIRWVDRSGQMRMPNEFIGIAEQTGLIGPIGDWVLESVCRFVGERKSQFKARNATIGFNVSCHQLNDPEFADKLIFQLEKNSIQGKSINIEITESVFDEMPNRVIENLTTIRRAGCKIYLDDFGTGYSSLSNLHRYPIDTIKIDRSFVSGEYENRFAIVEAIIAIADAFGMDVVAEGIETADQLVHLQKLGCRFGQGFFFDKPMPIESAIKRMGEKYSLQRPATFANSALGRPLTSNAIVARP